MEVYFVLAEVSSDKGVTRLCLALKKKFPDIREWQLKQIQVLCEVATEHENCFFMLEDTWLKTTVFLKDPKSFLQKPLQIDELTKGTIIRRNVLPRQRYWTKLEEVCHRSTYWRILDRSLLERKDRKNRGEKCELARSLPTTDVQDAASEPTNLEAMVLRIVKPATEVSKVKLIAKGGEGEVWEVVWNNCTYAMKSFDAKAGPFTNEHNVAVLEKVLHPHIVHAFGRSPISSEQPCLLMELLDGDLLRCVYESERAGTLHFSRVDKLDVLLQIASAMRNLHDNHVVHGDLKLGNILLSDFEVSGNVRHFLAKVADFGSAQIIDSTSPFVPSNGTTCYASPEVLERRVIKSSQFPAYPGPPVLDISTPTKLDVYSFGVVAYEILTGCRAFEGELYLSQMPSVMKGDMKCSDWRNLGDSLGYFDEVIPLVESCLEIEPGKRPTFSELCYELTICKSNLQDLETVVAACQNFFVCLSVLVFMLFIFLHYASEAWIKVVLFMVPTCSIGSWAYSFNFRSILSGHTSGSNSKADTHTEVTGLRSKLD